MASTLLAKTVCLASDQLGRLSPDRQDMQAQFHRLAFAEGTGGDCLGNGPTDINLSYQRNCKGAPTGANAWILPMDSPG